MVITTNSIIQPHVQSSAFAIGESGPDTIIINGDGNYVSGGLGSDTFYINGNYNDAEGSNGGDSYTVKGNGNTMEAGKMGMTVQQLLVMKICFMQGMNDNDEITLF